jgi:hypothetical protein
MVQNVIRTGDERLTLEVAIDDTQFSMITRLQMRQRLTEFQIVAGGSSPRQQLPDSQRQAAETE